MDDSPLIKFQQLNPHYYMCKSCRTHIALAEDFLFYRTLEPDVIGAIFNKCFNINVEDKTGCLKEIAWEIFADVYCKGCNSRLGLICVEADKYETLIKRADKHETLINRGMVQLNKKKLVMRHGNDFFDGGTMAQLPRPDHYMCKNCRTHVALVEDLCEYASKIADEHRVSRIIFKKVINVRIIPDVSLLHKVGLHTFAGVDCANCNLRLGWKMVASDVRSFTTMVQSEQVELYIKTLLKTQGNNILPAETMIPPSP